MAESAAGDLPGLGDVLEGFAEIQRELKIECDFSLPGVWELGRKKVKKDSPISWNDSGTLGVVNDVPGGTVDPGKLVSGLAQAAQQSGALIFEHARVEKISYRAASRIGSVWEACSRRPGIDCHQRRILGAQ